jgi:soluble lytic murein transglycosylase-like protein
MKKENLIRVASTEAEVGEKFAGLELFKPPNEAQLRTIRDIARVNEGKLNWDYVQNPKYYKYAETAKRPELLFGEDWRSLAHALPEMQKFGGAMPALAGLSKLDFSGFNKVTVTQAALANGLKKLDTAVSSTAADLTKNIAKVDLSGGFDLESINGAIKKSADEFKLDPALLRAIVAQESAFNPMAVSRKGAQGLMQLMPATATQYGVKDPFNIEENVRGGANYFRDLFDQFGGDLKLSLAAYNAGPGAVVKAGGIPKYPETQPFVNKIVASYGSSTMALQDLGTAASNATSMLQQFNPFGSGYDYASATKAGLGPDETGHWPSRVPDTGLLLKGASHQTWYKTMQGEEQAGYQTTFKEGRYYSELSDSMLGLKRSVDGTTVSFEGLGPIAQTLFNIGKRSTFDVESITGGPFAPVLAQKDIVITDTLADVAKTFKRTGKGFDSGVGKMVKTAILNNDVTKRFGIGVETYVSGTNVFTDTAEDWGAAVRSSVTSGFGLAPSWGTAGMTSTQIYSM